MRARRWRQASSRSRKVLRAKSVVIAVAALLLAGGTVLTAARNASAALGFEVQSLDGSGNNKAHPEWGRAGQPYPRVTNARYADGHSQPVSGPNSRFISNRVFQDIGQNVFSEHRATQWLWTWGQFLDHTFGLRDENGTAADIPFNSGDPLEKFTDNLGVIPFSRTGVVPGTGVTNPRQQPNTTNSYISAWAVYGGTNQRLEWLRNGTIDGNVTNNQATLMLPGGFLPRRDARGDPASAPVMAIDGRLAANPAKAMVAGDVRANENIALTATHTLFAREHNRIVGLLPNTLTQEEKFQIARRIVIAEQQYITYNEFLPAAGVPLPKYTGYNPNLNAAISNEFASVGYRAHSMIHGEFEVEADADTYTPAQLTALQNAGVEVTRTGDEVALGISLNLAFFNPDLLQLVQLGPMLKAIGGESEYNNDEMIDNHLRSVLFQIPVSGNPECFDDPSLPNCFKGVVDLAAIDIERGRDHGMPSYNDMRRAFGLAPKTSFRAITGEASESFPPGSGVNDPTSLDFTKLSDIDGKPVALPDTVNNTATKATRKTPLAARLKAVYGSVDSVDAFVGMSAEPHMPGSELGELQQAMWEKQFAQLRDGDRFFYGNDPGLSLIKQQYGIDFHHSLADVIAANTDIPQSDLNDNVFLTPDDDLPAATCSVSYHLDSAWSGAFQVSLTITNLGSTPINNGWALRFQFANGQDFQQLWNGTVSQGGNQVAVGNPSWNPVIPANGGKVTDVGFIAHWDDTTNASPPNFTLNNARCARG